MSKFDERLDEILRHYLGRVETYKQVHRGLREDQTGDIAYATGVTKQAICTLIEQEVIGEDEPQEIYVGIDTYEATQRTVGRNQQRAEQRQALKKLMKGGDSDAA